jgi:hypothetical protein
MVLVGVPLPLLAHELVQLTRLLQLIVPAEGRRGQEREIRGIIVSLTIKSG